MNQTEVENFVESLDDVKRQENMGYIFFFVGDDIYRPFVTIANTDQEFDNVSNLDREGVFRINIGLSRGTFNELVGDYDPEDIDYSELDVVLPHPDYAKQLFVCILSPTGENEALTKELIKEAHSIAAARLERKSSN